MRHWRRPHPTTDTATTDTGANLYAHRVTSNRRADTGANIDPHGDSCNRYADTGAYLCAHRVTSNRRADTGTNLDPHGDSCNRCADIGANLCAHRTTSNRRADAGAKLDPHGDSCNRCADAGPECAANFATDVKDSRPGDVGSYDHSRHSRAVGSPDRIADTRTIVHRRRRCCCGGRGRGRRWLCVLHAAPAILWSRRAGHCPLQRHRDVLHLRRRQYRGRHRPSAPAVDPVHPGSVR